MPHTIVGLPTVNARTGGGADVGRDRWTLSLHFTFFGTVDPELMIVKCIRWGFSSRTCAGVARW